MRPLLHSWTHLTGISDFVQQLYINKLPLIFHICEGNAQFSDKGAYFFFPQIKDLIVLFFFFSLAGALRSHMWIQPPPVSDTLAETSLSNCFWTTGNFCLWLTCSLSIGTLYNSLLPSFWEKKINVLGLKAARLDAFYFSSARKVSAQSFSCSEMMLKQNYFVFFLSLHVMFPPPKKGFPLLL